MLIDPLINLCFASANMIGIIANFLSYNFITKSFDTSKCHYHIMSLDSASGAIAAFMNLGLNLLSWYFGITGSVYCNLLILTGPLRIILGPSFSLASAIIR